jgi:hypothetical protein
VPAAPNVTLQTIPAAVYPAAETLIQPPAAPAPPSVPAMPAASLVSPPVELFVKTPELPSILHRELRLDAPEAATTSASATPASATPEAGTKSTDNGPSHNYRRLFSSLRIHRS